MNKTLKTVAAALAISAFGITNASASVIKIETKGFTNDTLLVNNSVIKSPFEQSKLDTLVLKKGKAEYKFDNDKPVYVTITPNCALISSNGRQMRGPVSTITMYVNPNETSKVKAIYDATNGLTYTVDGSATNVAVSKAFASVQPLGLEYSRLIKGYMEKTIPEEEAVRKVNEVFDSMQSKITSWVTTNPKDEANLYLITEMAMNYNPELEVKLDNSLKSSIIYPIFQDIKDRYNRQKEMEAQRQRNAANVADGVEAKDFTLTDINGKPFTLSSLRGKYVILDFWGSWCGWCIKGMPKLKEYYAANSSKVEVVGVDCRDTEEAWRNAVSKHELPWINVRVPKDAQGDTNVPLTYAIEGYPTKFLIDPQGKIALKVVGEDPNFYNQVDAIINVAK